MGVASKSSKSSMPQFRVSQSDVSAPGGVSGGVATEISGCGPSPTGTLSGVPNGWSETADGLTSLDVPALPSDASSKSRPQPAVHQAATAQKQHTNRRESLRDNLVSAQDNL